MQLEKMTKEIVDTESEKIRLITKQIECKGEDKTTAFKMALVIYSQRREDVYITEEDD